MKKGMVLIGWLLISTASIQAQKSKKPAATTVKKGVAPVTTVIAHIKGLTDPHVTFTWYDGATHRTDTVAVQGGKYRWTAPIPDPQNTYLWTSHGYMEFFAEKGTIYIEGSKDSLYYSKVKGSSTQKEYEAYTATVAYLYEGRNKIYGKLHEAKEAEEKARLEQQVDSVRKLIEGEKRKYIQKHPGSVVSVLLIEDMAVMGEYADIHTMYSSLNLKTQQTAMGRRLGNRVVELKRSALGTPMKDFEQADPNGRTVRLSDFKGNYVFVDFWASWCGPCRAENPNVLKAYNAFKDQNFTVLGVSLDDKKDKWVEAIQKDGMPWTQVSDLKGFDNAVSSYYGIRAIPYSFLLDPEGKIIAKGLRGAELHSYLTRIILDSKNEASQKRGAR